jgi:hypothetical protein
MHKKEKRKTNLTKRDEEKLRINKQKEERTGNIERYDGVFKC